MFIYLAVAGEIGEGYHVMGAFTFFEDAKCCAFQQKAHFDEEEWKSGQNSSRSWWYNGCDFIEVIKMEVK